MPITKSKRQLNADARSDAMMHMLITCACIFFMAICSVSIFTAKNTPKFHQFIADYNALPYTCLGGANITGYHISPPLYQLPNHAPAQLHLDTVAVVNNTARAVHLTWPTLFETRYGTSQNNAKSVDDALKQFGALHIADNFTCYLAMTPADNKIDKITKITILGINDEHNLIINHIYAFIAFIMLTVCTILLICYTPQT